MFDISFGELAIIGLVALVVLGPERLPKVARMAGHLLGRAQRYVNTVKADINREMQLEELKTLQQQMELSAHEVQSSVNAELLAARVALDEAAALQPINAEVTPLPPAEAIPLAESPAVAAPPPAAEIAEASPASPLPPKAGA